MPGRAARLYGRDRAVHVVREFMERPERGRRRTTREAPILLFEGPRGSGKTALLDLLARSLDGKVPYARVDFEDMGEAAGYEVLAALAFELNRQGGDYGRLGFPRFIVGRVIMEEKLDDKDRGQAYRQVKARLEQARNIAALRGLIQMIAPPLQPILGIPQQIPVPDFAGLLLNGLLASGRRGRRLLLGAGQDWYGDQDLGLGHDPIDELVKLNSLHARGDREAVDGLLMSAFLADLRDDFEHRRAARQPYTAAVLLDNVDTEEGRQFLLDLTQSRRAREADGRAAIPLTFVATSRGELTTRVAQDLRPYARLDDAGRADRRRRGATARWWYPIVLPNLDRSQVTTMVTALGLHAVKDRRIAEMIYRFTGGHPGSTSRLIWAIADRSEGPYDVRGLLDGPDPSGGDTLGERILNDLLGRRSEEEWKNLLVAAAARHQDDAARLAVPGGLLGAHADLVQAPDLWGGGDPSEPAVLEPVMRRLLLRRLATVDGDGDWPTVHQRLRVLVQKEDEVGDLYYGLALGDVRKVTRRLAALLAELDGEAWLALLDTVVTAPRRTTGGGAPLDEAQRLAAWAANETGDEAQAVQVVAPLLTALWLVTDPLIGVRRRDLHHAIAIGYNAAAPFCRRQALWLRAQDHSSEARRWD
ncbi:AAA family ATPase [Actinoallomurus spadix]|uniref:AAA+ ATPase domain-containing protein n=1 Tax=Actinoallomurus spadix TaxID=79912 RepID=A0ABP3HB75_9ACTN|nr:AAA family ATPase [Actinoallomurus spadix]MCO5984997.1 AAA family ATPase [Actinoallomurus spadix]